MRLWLAAAALSLVLLPACGADDRGASRPIGTTTDESALEPFSKADVERAFADVELDFELESLDGVCDFGDPPESDVQILDEGTCNESFVNLDPSVPNPQFFGSGGQDASFWSVGVWASEAEAKEAAAPSPDEDVSLTPASEGWRTERAGNVIVLYKEPMQALIRSALNRL